MDTVESRLASGWRTRRIPSLFLSRALNLLFEELHLGPLLRRLPRRHCELSVYLCEESPSAFSDRQKTCLITVHFHDARQILEPRAEALSDLPYGVVFQSESTSYRLLRTIGILFGIIRTFGTIALIRTRRTCKSPEPHSLSLIHI